MRRWFGVILMCVVVLCAFGQTYSPKYQPGTIMAVTEHHNPDQRDPDSRQYDVSIKVGNSIFVVLFTPPNGSNTVTQALGDELLVLVGSKTLTFNNASVKTEVPILSRETLSAKDLDLSKTPGEYFDVVLQQLSAKLTLSDAQQTKIRPIVEQEAGEVGEIFGNPAVSPADELSEYQAIVSRSDAHLKPLLSPNQLGKLHDLRKQQRQQVKQMIAQQKNSQP